MKRFSLLSLFVAAIATTTLTLVSFDAEARRLGGARSSGMTRDSSVMKREAIPPKPAAPTQQQAAATGAKPGAATPQPSGMSRWMGPLAGLAAGLGIAALLSHFGLGEGMASFLMLALLVFAAIFVVRLLMRKKAPEQRMAYAGAPEPMRFEPVSMPSGGSTAAAADIPAGFDVEGFIRQAKLNFLRLQSANDAGNMDDIRQFTSPEMFAEVKMQYEERGRAAQHTDVVEFDAQLLDVTGEDKRQVASVRFFGRIREEAGGPVEAFDEVWHLTRPADASAGWVVAGIQQMN